jgi:hypothetical protein
LEGCVVNWNGYCAKNTLGKGSKREDGGRKIGRREGWQEGGESKGSRKGRKEKKRRTLKALEIAIASSFQSRMTSSKDSRGMSGLHAGNKTPEGTEKKIILIPASFYPLPLPLPHLASFTLFLFPS